MKPKKTITILAALCMAITCAAQADKSIFNVKTPKRVSVHDPSIVIGYSKDGKITGEPSDGAKKVYYIFGSHKAWARSNDMQNWTTFTNNLNSSFATIFKEDAAWAAKGGNQGNSAGYNVSGNLWAPDVIWNKDMQKWCMYMSVNGDNWYSSIVLLTADNLSGNWTRVGPVVYSGFTNATEAEQTDFYRVYTGTGFPSRYNLNRNGVHTYGTNAIDPCVFYDEDGNLWMTYGSWFGGLYMLRLDKTTGLRDYTYTYKTTDGTATGATSDVYQGLKLAGGNHCSGEASYIEYINDRYYLFVTYGGLTANGGYNMRVFSSKEVTGPYKDLYGHPAIWSNSNSAAGNTKQNVGARLMSYYKWDLLGSGYVAQGHNSAVVDDDGKCFLVYHTRFTTSGEWHEVRVHQMFAAQNGGLVAAPFEYSGETLQETAFDNAEVAGTYKIIYHEGTDYANLVCQKEKTLTLNPDGTVTGAYKGTWKQDADKPNLTLTLGSTKLQGVIIRQKMEGLNYENLCFTVIGSTDIPMWGYKDVSEAVGEAIKDVKQLPISELSVLDEHIAINDFNAATPNKSLTEETGISLSFFVSGLDSDWNEIAKSTDDKFTLYLSVLRYNGADFYEAKATPDPKSPIKTDLWKAYLNGNYYATVSYNPDGTIAYYRNGTKLFTYAANLTPSYGAGVTPKDIAKAVTDYYRNQKLTFTRTVYDIIVGYSTQYDEALTAGIETVRNPDSYNNPGNPESYDNLKNIGIINKTYNLQGQKVSPDYRGIIIQNGRKILRR